MIAPAKRMWFRRLFGRHCRSRLATTFGAVHVVGLDAARAVVAAQPVLVVSNHQSWWDPLVALLVEEALGADGYALMDARNLRRLPFFRMVGALGVDLQEPGDGAVALRACRALLDRPGRLLWVFPQGEERPDDPRPLGFRPGAAALAVRAPGVATLPVGIRYVFAGDERPRLVVSIGAPLAAPADVPAGVVTQDAAVVAELDRIRGWLADGHLDRQPALLRHRQGALGRLAETVLARLSRWWLPAAAPLAPVDLPARSAGPVPATQGDG
ncbi:MAG: 1-acyl-sn-glycerol-3-phosphate acyltransferase [Alphaproteobacteria bacterium]|nr:1-acyl-sn-glycerol-3-phosphate acyltransferase [Alphaproteobacteria bacterium]